ncbi:LEAF RUST 10 DISEASE-RESISTANCEUS RECEPTOR-LIKE PROTEIN KINASE-like 2.1 [Pyrus communis]|uniref:LEAF RUST 10 DISEASE-RESISTANCEUS RECEPTOR-LIKE PROTEIN KINASE-like 2.1 n=1 Tax=Pyrus communis TaxID=23211 RepID=UPI0035BF690D
MEISGTRSFTLSLALSLAFLLLCFCSETCKAKDNTSAKSCTSSCGHIHNISHPFRLTDDPKHCGNVSYTLYCDSNITVLDLPTGKYYVQAINYNNKTIRLLDFGLQSNNCSSMSQNIPVTYDTISLYWLAPEPSAYIYYLKCLNPSNSSLYVDTAPCLNNTSSSSSSQPKTYSYVTWPEFDGEFSYFDAWDLDEGCSVEWMSSVEMSWAAGYVEDYSNLSYKDIHNALMYGFELYFESPYTASRCPGWTANYASPCFPPTISGAPILD